MAGDDTPLGEAAMSSLATANDAKATELMITAFDERGVLPPANALNHLATHGGDDGWSLLEEILATGDMGSRKTVVWALQQRGDRDAADRLLDLARNGDRNVSAAALGSLEQMGDHARDGLRKLLMERVTEGTDADFGQSVQVLARLGGDEVLELLTTRLEEGTVQEKQTALGALGQMGDPSAIAAVARVFHESDDASVRVQALNQLLWSDEADSDLLDAAMADDDPSIVAAVASSLAQRGGEEATTRLFQLAESEESSVRIAAITSLVQVGGEGAEEVLLAGLRDPEVAPSIMWSVNSSSSPVVRDALRELAREGEPVLRANAISALSMDTDPGTTDLIVAALRDEDQTVAQSALYALQSRGSTSAAEAIAEMMDELADDEGGYGLRHQAASVLQAIGGPIARDRAELIDHILNPAAPDIVEALSGFDLSGLLFDGYDIR
jgi:HEAT repeat protein